MHRIENGLGAALAIGGLASDAGGGDRDEGKTLTRLDLFLPTTIRDDACPWQSDEEGPPLGTEAKKALILPVGQDAFNDPPGEVDQARSSPASFAPGSGEPRTEEQEGEADEQCGQERHQDHRQQEVKFVLHVSRGTADLRSEIAQELSTSRIMILGRV
jgi:hypothetical protein